MAEKCVWVEMIANGKMFPHCHDEEVWEELHGGAARVNSDTSTEAARAVHENESARESHLNFKGKVIK